MQAAARALGDLPRSSGLARPTASLAVHGRRLVLAEGAALRALERMQPCGGARGAQRGAQAGVRTLPWLDDFAFFRQGSYAEACAARDFVGTTFFLLGLLRAEGKGQWEPSHFLEDHLGYAIDSERGLFLLTPGREAKLASGVKRVSFTVKLR